MPAPAHTYSDVVGRELVLVERGIGTPNQVRVAEAARAELAGRWGTGRPALVDPVFAVEYDGHNDWTGGGLIVNKSRRMFEIWACAAVRAEALAALSAAADKLGFRLEQKQGNGPTYFVLAR